MNKKRFTLSGMITIVVLAVAVAISATMMIAIRHFNRQVNAVMQKQVLYTHISDIDTKVREYFPTLDEEQLQAALAAGYVKGLSDPYAAYLNTQDYKEAQLERQGKSSAAGIALAMSEKNEVMVEKVYTESAAHKVGVQKDDVLLSVDGEEVNSSNLQKMQEKLDTATSKLLLSVRRGDKTLSFDVTAYTFSIDTVTERMLKGNIGYICITAFYDNTESQFTAAYSALQDKGATSFIFDVRNCNHGGSRQALEGVLSYLMPHGAYAVYTANDGTVTNLVAHSSHTNTAPAVVLVNGETKGEAEIFAGVLQEFKTATVVGEKTAGKGKVQEFVPLKEDNSALLLSAGEISLVSGGAIEGVGITPDTVAPMSLYKTNRIGVLKDAEDDQLQAALEALSVKLSGNAVEESTVGTTTGSTAKTNTKSKTSKK